MTDDIKQKNEKEEVVEQTEEVEDTQVAELEKKVADLEAQVKYAVADYRNLEKRNEDEKREFVKYANRELLLQLLPAFETLFLAEKYIKDEGLKLTVKKLNEMLELVGVKRIKTVGEKYKAEQMECVQVVDGEENTVIEETKPGFTLYDKTLVPAQVKVGGKEAN